MSWLRIFVAILFFILSVANAYDLRSLDSRRLIQTDNKYFIKHFHIYWGGNFPQNDIWLEKKDGLPKFISILSEVLEVDYHLFLDNNLTLPPKINVYLLNTNLITNEPHIKLDDISSFGAFTSDELPEILINSNISGSFKNGKYISAKSKLNDIVLHELMHAYQYTKNIIDKENPKGKNLWFTEGLALGFQLCYSDNDYYRDLFQNYLLKNINKGFLYDEYYLSYTTGLFFEFLVKEKGVRFKDFYEILDYNEDFSKDLYFKRLTKKLNIKNIYKLFYQFYKTLDINKCQNSSNNYIFFGGAYCAKDDKTYFINGFKPKNLYEDFLVGEGEVLSSSYKDSIKIQKGWHIYLSNNTLDEATLSSIKGIFWLYQDGMWSCRGDDRINKICRDRFNLISKIEVNSGFWLHSDTEQNIVFNSLKSHKQKNLFFNNGWNLTGNPTDETIFFNEKYLVWYYHDKNWYCSYLEDITIPPDVGYWIFKK